MPKPKVVVILGPTSSGKSDLAVRLAEKFDGEVVSADSRQVYRGLDLASGKITRKEMGGVPHHLLDVASPRTCFSVTRYQKLADAAIRKILRKGKLPIICGGTGLYLDALLYDYNFPAVKPDPRLRKKLEKLPAEKLFAKLKGLDPRRAGNIDPRNPRRLIRALEIAISSRKPVPSLERQPRFDALKIGLFPPPDQLKKRIEKRLDQRLKAGMVAEIRRLRQNGLSFRRLESLGLESRYIGRFLQGKISRAKARDDILRNTLKYVKRQLTWWRKDREIARLSKPADYYRQSAELIKKFLV
jgi:tRNA dimethylallyltransferase